jgi:large subunit ribosomal protein L19
MNQTLLAKIEKAHLRKKPLKFSVGDTVRVHTKVVEGDKERIQVFAGLVIGRRGHGINETFTVRRISYGEGVERVFPVNSARIEKVEVERQGKVRRAKLNYLRQRVGKSALAVKEKEVRRTGAKTRTRRRGRARTKAASQARETASADTGS